MQYQHQYDVYVAGFMRGRRGFYSVDVVGYFLCGNRGRLIRVLFG